AEVQEAPEADRQARGRDADRGGGDRRALPSGGAPRPEGGRGREPRAGQPHGRRIERDGAGGIRGVDAGAADPRSRPPPRRQSPLAPCRYPSHRSSRPCPASPPAPPPSPPPPPPPP